MHCCLSVAVLIYDLFLTLLILYACDAVVRASEPGKVMVATSMVDLSLIVATLFIVITSAHQHTKFVLAA